MSDRARNVITTYYCCKQADSQISGISKALPSGVWDANTAKAARMRCVSEREKACRELLLRLRPTTKQHSDNELLRLIESKARTCVAVLDVLLLGTHHTLPLFVTRYYRKSHVVSIAAVLLSWSSALKESHVCSSDGLIEVHSFGIPTNFRSNSYLNIMKQFDALYV
jgi:hypothetical protein